MRLIGSLFDMGHILFLQLRIEVDVGVVSNSFVASVCLGSSSMFDSKD